MSRGVDGINAITLRESNVPGQLVGASIKYTKVGQIRIEGRWFHFYWRARQSMDDDMLHFLEGRVIQTKVRRSPAQSRNFTNKGTLKCGSHMLYELSALNARQSIGPLPSCWGQMSIKLNYEYIFRLHYVPDSQSILPRPEATGDHE